ncbi:unnamed protein product [Urochloa humidicola]
MRRPLCSAPSAAAGRYLLRVRPARRRARSPPRPRPTAPILQSSKPASAARAVDTSSAAPCLSSRGSAGMGALRGAPVFPRRPSESGWRRWPWAA